MERLFIAAVTNHNLFNGTLNVTIYRKKYNQKCRSLITNKHALNVFMHAIATVGNVS